MTDDKINEFAPAVSVFAASSDTSENLFVILGTNEKGEKIAVYFDVNDKAKKIIRYYNSELLENEVDGH